MKEKRLLAMFITSAVTLITSLAVTFGVLLTLADPVVATGVTRYDYAFNKLEANTLVKAEDKTLSLVDEIVFQPSSSLSWSTSEKDRSVWFNGLTYEDDIVYADESISAKMKVLPIRVSNNYSKAISTYLSVSLDNSLLAKYTHVMLYDYVTGYYEEITGLTKNIQLSVGNYKDYAIVIYSDDSDNTSLYEQIDYGTDFLTFNVSIRNSTNV